MKQSATIPVRRVDGADALVEALNREQGEEGFCDAAPAAVLAYTSSAKRRRNLAMSTEVRRPVTSIKLLPVMGSMAAKMLAVR